MKIQTGYYKEYMSLPEIPLSIARRMALRAQLFGNNSRLPKGKEGVARIVDKLGYIQIDTIAVIERAHHHTLWTRFHEYTPAMLHDLQAVDRRIFEYWGHAASYLPISDYRFYIPRMHRFVNPGNSWEKERLKKYGHLMKPILERIRSEGPLGSRDFASTGKKRGTWWDWRPAKTALEMLFWRGELMITERRNFSRIYDLTERVLPEQVDTRVPETDELGRFLVRRALDAFGVARLEEICDHLHAAPRETIAQALKQLLDSGEVTGVQIAEDQKVTYYAHTEYLERSGRLRKSKPRLHILSPFDNLIIQRHRTNRLFGFDYSLECYLPAHKRKYGYFVLPILWNENLVARLDVKADRKNQRLILNSLQFEPSFKSFNEMLPALVEKLRRFAAFNNCRDICIKNVSPAKFKREIAGLMTRNCP
nr:YcaQ family DNA glycosylase [candidate division Zixibacteria bacterium]